METVIISVLNLGKSRSVSVNEPAGSDLLVYGPLCQAKLGGSRQIRDKACASPPRKINGYVNGVIVKTFDHPRRAIS